MSLNYDAVCHPYFKLMVKLESTLIQPRVNLRLTRGNACVALPPFQLLLLYSPVRERDAHLTRSVRFFAYLRVIPRAGGFRADATPCLRKPSLIR
jgi:hypothetical protein